MGYRRFRRRSRRLASSGMVLRSGRKVGGPRRRGWLATGAAVAGAAARGAGWLKNSVLGKRAASAAASFVAGKARRVIRRKFAPSKEAENGAGASAQYSKTVGKLGKYRSHLFNFRKLISKNMRTDICRIGGAARFTDTNGYFPLWLQNGLTNVETRLPMTLLQLTGLPYVSGTADLPTVNTYPLVEFHMRDVTGNILTRVRSAAATNGSGISDYWNRFVANKEISVSNAVLEYSNIKLLFRCPKARPGWVKVSLVQFTDDKINPDSIGPAQTTADTDFNGFWQARAKALMYNPISHEQNVVPRATGMKVIKTWTRRWNPDTSDNLATYNGEQLRMDLFIRHNRYCNLTGPSVGMHVGIGQLDNDAFVDNQPVEDVNATESSIYNCPKNLKARVYLLIEATNFDAPTGAFSSSNHVTYDMEVRNKWVYQDTGFSRA